MKQLKKKSFSRYDINTRSSSFYYTDKVTTTPGYALHSEKSAMQLKITLPVIIVSMSIFYVNQRISINHVKGFT